MELLDDLRLPKMRVSDILVGIWVLNKGKLVAPPVPAEGLAPTTPIPPPLVPSALTHETVNPASIVPAPLVTAAPLQISPETLAAEVASLTPEQIQLMLQTLSASKAIPPTPIPQQMSPPHVPVPPQPHNQSQPWPGSAPGFPGGYSSPQSQQNPPSRGSYSQAPFTHYEHGQEGYNRGGRGWNDDGRERGRGRGRGRGRDYDDQRKPLDSGWAGSRNRGSWDGPPRGGRRGWS